MKKVLIAIILLGFIVTLITTVQAKNSIKLSGITPPQTDTIHHKVYKKHKKAVRRVSSQKSARMQKQLKQADKHLRDEQKVQKAQQELKKDTLHTN